MRDVVEYLETLGRGAPSGSGSGQVAGLRRFDASVREAVLAGDAVSLRLALGLAPVFACMVSAPNDDEREFEEQPAAPDEQPDESEARVA